jgi:hypothetical protein
MASSHSVSVTKHGVARGRRPVTFRPRVDVLEDRWLPSTLADYGRLPLAFEPNQGQVDAQVNYLARGTDYALFLTGTATVLSLQQPGAVGSDIFRLQLVGGNPAPAVQAQDQLPGTSNYFLGNDPSQWQVNLPNFGSVAYRQVYAGIDLVYYSNAFGQLEYDFRVAPGADPSQIRLQYTGAQGVELNAQGDLVVHLLGGDLVQQAPNLYQDIAGVRTPVAGTYTVNSDGTVGLALGGYDPTQALVIDPVLTYSTFLGGNNIDRANAIAVDAAGNAYITGQAGSSNFPTTAGAFQTTSPGDDAFVTKLSPAGARLYSTYLGGAGLNAAESIAINAGEAFITGFTQSANFPTTAGAFQTTAAGGPSDVFVTRLNATGSALVYSTYLGGAGGESGHGIAVDPGTGDAFVTGETTSTNFPTTAGVLQTAAPGGGDAFVTRLNATGTALVYSTYLGGNGNDIGFGIAVDSADAAYVTGSTDSINFPTTAGAFQATAAGGGDAFITKLNATGSGLVYSTYLGGAGTDQGNGVAIDSAGAVYVTGSTDSTNFPTASPLQAALDGISDAFVTKLNATGTAPVYSTYLGGARDDGGAGIAVDAAGEAFLTGATNSADFPTLGNPVQAVNVPPDAYVTKLNATGTALVYSIYLGGGSDDSGLGIAVDAGGDAYVAGTTESVDFPTANATQATYGGGLGDAFVARVSQPGPLTYTAPAGVTHTMTLSLVGSLIQLVDNNVVVLTKPLATTTQIQITGANGFNNQLTVDNNSGGLIALPGNPIPAIVFTGGTGAAIPDRLFVTGTPAADTIIATGTYVFVDYQQYIVSNNTGVELTNGGAGDIAFLFGTGDNNGAVEDISDGVKSADISIPNIGLLTALGFPQVRMFAGSSISYAQLGDIWSGSLFVGTPTYSYIASTAGGPDSLCVVSGFGTVDALAQFLGDAALLFDSAGADVFTASPQDGTLVGPGYKLSVTGFDQIRASAGAANGNPSGMDTAILTDGPSLDLLRSQTLFAGQAPFNLTFLNSPVGRSSIDLAFGFATVTTQIAGNSGATADLYDSPGDDTFFQGVPSPIDGKLVTPTYTVNVSNFATVRITSSLGGHDVVVPGTITYSFSAVGPWQQQ